MRIQKWLTCGGFGNVWEFSGPHCYHLIDSLEYAFVYNFAEDVRALFFCSTVDHYILILRTLLLSFIRFYTIVASWCIFCALVVTYNFRLINLPIIYYEEREQEISQIICACAYLLFFRYELISSFYIII